MSIKKLWEKLYSPHSVLMETAIVDVSFPFMKRVDMGNGAWVKKIEENNNFFILKGFAPKGYVYSETFHDTKKHLFVASGKIKETNSTLTKVSCDYPFRIAAGIDNGFVFLEDSTYYVKFFKT